MRREKDRLMELDRVMSMREAALKKKLEVFENRNQLVEVRLSFLQMARPSLADAFSRRASLVKWMILSN